MSTAAGSITRTEAALIRNKLAVRFNDSRGCYEVYTTIHGSGIFKWFTISAAIYQWYIQTFPDIAVVDTVYVDEDGGIVDTHSVVGH